MILKNPISLVLITLFSTILIAIVLIRYQENREKVEDTVKIEQKARVILAPYYPKPTEMVTLDKIRVQEL